MTKKKRAQRRGRDKDKIPDQVRNDRIGTKTRFRIKSGMTEKTKNEIASSAKWLPPRKDPFEKQKQNDKKERNDRIKMAVRLHPTTPS
jgi:hypothetical protein